MDRDRVGLYTPKEYVPASSITPGDVIYTGSEWRTVVRAMGVSSLAIHIDDDAYYVPESRHDPVQRVRVARGDRGGPELPPGNVDS